MAPPPGWLPASRCLHVGVWGVNAPEALRRALRATARTLAFHLREVRALGSLGQGKAREWFVGMREMLLADPLHLQNACTIPQTLNNLFNRPKKKKKKALSLRTRLLRARNLTLPGTQ